MCPTTRNHKVRKLLKTGKAVIHKYKPFTIQLLYEPETKVVKQYIAGKDPGRDNLGLSVVDETGVEQYSAHITTRNKEIPKLMKTRAEHRHQSRAGERKVRQRAAKRNNTTFPEEENTRERILPKCEKPITVHYIKNTETKFCNRKRPEDWLTPTANQLLETHINAVEEMCEYLPITDFVLEINKFDFARLENPNIKPWEYENGSLKGTSVKELVYKEQDGYCLLCKNAIEHYHHIVPVAKNGSESVQNRVGLCKKHHWQVHNDDKVEARVKSKKEGLEKKFGALSVLNQIFPKFIEYLIQKFGEDHVFFTDGFTTAEFRREHNIQKTHEKDAYCIACQIIDDPVIDYDIETYEIKQFRRHNRQLIKARYERKYYKVEKEIIEKPFKNGKTNIKVKEKKVLVATNRHKRCNQKSYSLTSYRTKLRETYDEKTVDKMISQLVVEKGRNRYRSKNLIMPGAIFIYENKRYVLSGTCNYGNYFMAVGYDKKTFPTKKCKVVAQNTGFVYL